MPKDEELESLVEKSLSDPAFEISLAPGTDAPAPASNATSPYGDAGPEALARMPQGLHLSLASPRYLEEPPPPPLQKWSSGELLKRLCSDCHSSSLGIGGRLPLEDLGKMKTYLGTGGRTPAAMLGLGIMPPRGALQPTPEQRMELVRQLGAAER